MYLAVCCLHWYINSLQLKKKSKSQNYKLKTYLTNEYQSTVKYLGPARVKTEKSEIDLQNICM